MAVAFMTGRAMVQNPSPPTTDNFSLRVLAAGLKLNTLQGLAVVQDSLIVPTMDGEIVRVRRDGAMTVLTNLLEADLGIPFAIAPKDANSVVVTTSTYDPLHFLLQVGLDGTVTPIADLSEFNTPYGAPFGVVCAGDDYILAGSQDVINDRGLLYRVTAQGTIAEMVSLVEFGDPLELCLNRQQAIISMRNGDVLQVKTDRTKQITMLADLKKLGFGVAFGIVPQNTNYIMTTNTRKIIQVTPMGQVSVLYDLTPRNVGVPAGIAWWRERLVISTDGGLLLEIT
jgi:hypothetical protein